jgi:hypothetical protein
MIQGDGHGKTLCPSYGYGLCSLLEITSVSDRVADLLEIDAEAVSETSGNNVRPIVCASTQPGSLSVFHLAIVMGAEPGL